MAVREAEVGYNDPGRPLITAKRLPGAPCPQSPHGARADGPQKGLCIMLGTKAPNWKATLQNIHEALLALNRESAAPGDKLEQLQTIHCQIAEIYCRAAEDGSLPRWHLRYDDCPPQVWGSLVERLDLECPERILRDEAIADDMVEGEGIRRAFPRNPEKQIPSWILQATQAVTLLIEMLQPSGDEAAPNAQPEVTIIEDGAMVLNVTQNFITHPGINVTQQHHATVNPAPPPVGESVDPVAPRPQASGEVVPVAPIAPCETSSADEGYYGSRYYTKKGITNDDLRRAKLKGQVAIKEPRTRDNPTGQNRYRDVDVRTLWPEKFS